MAISLSESSLTPTSGNESSRAFQDKRYVESIDEYGPALERLARGYESSKDRRKDLLQEIHMALWRSFAVFDERCSLRTWVYRVAHITATKHVLANRRLRLHQMHSIEDVPDISYEQSDKSSPDEVISLQRLIELIERLKPIDRQVILLYLEELSAEEIGEVVGLSPRNIATKIHRIKKLLTEMFHARDRS